MGRLRQTLRRIRHGTLIVLTLLVGALLAAQVVVAAREKLTWSRDPDHALLVNACGSCHEVGRAYNYAKAPDEWRRTVYRMLDRDLALGHKFPEAERERIVAVLVRHRSADGAAVYRWRCGRCHGHDAIDRYRVLSAPALRELVRQHARQYNHAVQAWEGFFVADYVARLARPPGGGTSVYTFDNQDLYAQTCLSCHTVSFAYRTMCRAVPDANRWPDVVRRMRGKEPELIGEDRVPLLAGYARLVCQTGRPNP